ncbi:hypothetical protein [Streptomyces sp. NPDC002573]|uniref:hypothetical protein n=1 Tax=Streptomyces sp. NPDC002573 TaxID=3364651 RepID=UPI0036B83D6E
MARLRITAAAGGDLRQQRDSAAVDTDEHDEPGEGAPARSGGRPRGIVLLDSPEEGNAEGRGIDLLMCERHCALGPLVVKLRRS